MIPLGLPEANGGGGHSLDDPQDHNIFYKKRLITLLSIYLRGHALTSPGLLCFLLSSFVFIPQRSSNVGLKHREGRLSLLHKDPMSEHQNLLEPLFHIALVVSAEQTYPIKHVCASMKNYFSWVFDYFLVKNNSISTFPDDPAHGCKAKVIDYSTMGEQGMYQDFVMCCIDGSVVSS
jgi:hypothetical protein